MFEIIPAIDLLDGRVVQLEQGDPERATVYSEDPVAVAGRWEAAGARRLHVVDLDGALAGEPRHRHVITRIVASVDMSVQVAGGIRSVDSVRAWVDAGAARVITGTAALTDRDFLRHALDVAADRLVVALDARDGEVRVSGWQQGSGLDVVQTAVALAADGVRRLLVTDIARDGMLTGPNASLLAEVAGMSGVAVIASGGVSSVEDLVTLSALAPVGVEAAIVGSALYRGDLQLADALEAVG